MSWKSNDSWNAAASWAPKTAPPYTPSASSAGHTWDVAPDPAHAQEEPSTAWKGKGKDEQKEAGAKGKGKKGKDATGKAAEDAKQGGKKRSAPEREPEITEDDMRNIKAFADPSDDAHVNIDENIFRELYLKLVMFPLKVDKRPEDEHRGYRRLVDHYIFEYSSAEHNYIQKDMHGQTISRSVRVAVPDPSGQLIELNVKFPENNNIIEVLSFHRVVPRAPTWVTVDVDQHGKRWLLSAVIPES
jgi:hypothetical protein